MLGQYDEAISAMRARFERDVPGPVRFATLT